MRSCALPRPPRPRLRPPPPRPTPHRCRSPDRSRRRSQSRSRRSTRPLPPAEPPPEPPIHEAGAAGRLLAAAGDLEAHVAQARAQLDALEDALARLARYDPPAH